jgi:surface protein
MSEMFSQAQSFNQALENWNLSNVTDMSGVFDNALSFNHPLEMFLCLFKIIA